MPSSAAAAAALVASVRRSLVAAGYDPLAITWGPWWEASYYEV